MARKHYLDGEEWEIEVFANHPVKCKDCNGFVIALRNGELIDASEPDPTEEAKPRSEGYASLAEWNEAMDSFGDAFRTARFPEDRFADCCPSCGSRLINGKCPRCG